jgi:hypothetical protein
MEMNERSDEETVELLPEIMALIRAKYRTGNEVIQDLLIALAQTIVQADLPAWHIEKLKVALDYYIKAERIIEEDGLGLQ